MAYSVKIMPSAEANLENIIYFISLNSPVRAKTFTNELVTSIRNTLSTFPEGGTKHQGNIRKISYKGYTAFYRINEFQNLVEILHFVNLSKPLLNRGIDFKNSN